MGLQSINITVDNVNPMITYAPPNLWREGEISDPEFLSYDNHGTFTLSQQYGANVSFTFHGTAIWLFGAKRGNHGTYTVSLDGQPPTSGNGFNAPDIFGQALFNANCPNGEHTVVLTNTETNPNLTYVDIDYITYEVQVDDTLVAVTYQDTDFNYSGSWSTSPNNLGYYSGGTGHSTATTGASVSFSFTVRFLGSAVRIFGTSGPDNGGYTVQIDGGPLSSYNASKSTFSPQVLIYENNGLSPGNHTVELVNQPFTYGQTLNIDHALVSQPPSSSQSAVPQQSISSRSSSISGGAIGGIIAGVCVALALVVLFVLMRRRKAQKEAFDINSEAVIDMRDDDRMSMRPVPYYPVTEPSASQQDYAPPGSHQEVTTNRPVEHSPSAEVLLSATTYSSPGTHSDGLESQSRGSERAQASDRKGRRGLQLVTTQIDDSLPPAYH